jgi:PAS domain S-box-containing protein
MNNFWQQIKASWHRLPIENRGGIAIAIPLFCVFGAAAADSLLRQRLIESQAAVNHTNEVLVESQSTLISLLNAETGFRGYYISRQETYLAPYDAALEKLNPTLQNLAQLVQDNPPQAERVQSLSKIAQARMDALRAGVLRIETGEKSNPDQTADRLMVGKQLMDQARDVITEIEKEEYRLLEIRTRALQEQQAINANSMWIGLVLSILGTAITMRLLQQLATELREREVRLNESRNLIEAIVTNIVDAVLVINARGEVETFNRAAVAMFEYAPTEIIGRPWQGLLPQVGAAPDPQVPVHDAVVMPIGQIWQTMAQRKNGEWFPIEASINNIMSDDDRIVIIRDISDRQQAAAKLEAKAVELADLNAALNVTNQSLSQSNRELDQFAYITSHDLKAPLRAIANLSEWIEEDLQGTLSPEVQTNITLLRRRVYRMQALLNSLLEYSRAGRTQVPIATVDVAHLLTEIIEALAPPDTFIINIGAAMPVLRTRREPLRQVLTHLIDNGIRHHPTKTGILEVSVIEHDECYEFSVADDGDGIGIQFQEKIYTIFQTLQARDQKENVGAGLAIIKKILIAEGGTIRLESSSSNGSIFRFTWLKQPLTKAPYLSSH